MDRAPHPAIDRTARRASAAGDGAKPQRGRTPGGAGGGFRRCDILFRASTNIPLYEEALRRAGIPYYVVSGRGFFSAREVQDILYLLRALENPMDDFSLAVVLRSPLVGVSDDTLYWLSRDWSAWADGHALPGADASGGLSAACGRISTSPDALPPIAAR